MSSTCNKCHTEVPLDNDATIFDFLLSDNPFILFALSRHLLPVMDGDKVICVGSPSRAQYIEGQPRDSRGDYAYEPEQEALMRETYARLLDRAAMTEMPPMSPATREM